MAALSSYNVERSPFLRNNPQSAAAVGAAVFRTLAKHCGKRRKTNLVDGLVGWESSVGWFPFPDLPCTLPKELPSPTYRIDACTRVTTLAGRWFIYSCAPWTARCARTGTTRAPSSRAPSQSTSRRSSSRRPRKSASANSRQRAAR